MTDSRKHREAARLQKSQLCPDGKRRSDCVVRTTGEPDSHCGKPMVGTIEVIKGWRARMCHDCFELFGGYKYLAEVANGRTE